MMRLNPRSQICLDLGLKMFLQLFSKSTNPDETEIIFVDMPNGVQSVVSIINTVTSIKITQTTSPL